MKIMFLHPLLLKRNDHGYELRCMPTPWTWANDAKRNFIYRQLQLHKYRPSNTNFPPANFLLFNCDSSICNTR